jgi:NAD+ synthase (glutamine-hydrolysing)
MNPHGFLRVAAACPELRVADCPFNADRTLALMARAETQGVNLLVFPECGLTGYTCHDLFHLQSLQRAAEEALAKLVEKSGSVFRGVAVVGLPLAIEGSSSTARR